MNHSNPDRAAARMVELVVAIVAHRLWTGVKLLRIRLRSRILLGVACLEGT